MKKSIKQIFREGNEKSKARGEVAKEKLRLKNIAKLGKKSGVDTANVILTVTGQDKAGKNAMGTLWLEKDGSIGFSATIFNAKREYFWQAEEIGMVASGSKSVYGYIEIITNGGFSVKIASILKHEIKAFMAAWKETQK